MYAARVPQIAASVSCARREPNSIKPSLPTATLILAALVAIKVWKLIMFKIAVSTNCA